MWWDAIVYWGPLVIAVAGVLTVVWFRRRELRGLIVCPTCKGAGRIQPATPQQPAAPVAPQVRFITDQPEDALRDPCWCGLPRAICNAPFPNLPHSAADNDLYEHPRHAERAGACTSSEHAAPVAPGAETFGLQQCCRNWAWTPEMGPYAGIHHPRCSTLHATTPPDHQAGDEP
jgi:hypothetical protein